MFVYSEIHDWQNEPAIKQILVFSHVNAKENFEKEIERRFKDETNRYTGVDPDYLTKYRSNMSDSGCGAIYKLKSVLNGKGTFDAMIRCGFNGEHIWEHHASFTTPEEALWAAFGQMKKSILSARSQPLYDAVKKHYSVSGFMNQIKTKSELDEYVFVTNHKTSHVSVSFANKEDASKLFNLMQSLKIAALKNWND